MLDLRRRPLSFIFRARGASGIPAGRAAALATLTFLDVVSTNATVVATLLTAACAILAWNVPLIALARRRAQAPTLEILLRRQHYVQGLRFFPSSKVISRPLALRE